MILSWFKKIVKLYLPAPPLAATKISPSSSKSANNSPSVFLTSVPTGTLIITHYSEISLLWPISIEEILNRQREVIVQSDRNNEGYQKIISSNFKALIEMTARHSWGILWSKFLKCWICCYTISQMSLQIFHRVRRPQALLLLSFSCPGSHNFTLSKESKTRLATFKGI